MRTGSETHLPSSEKTRTSGGGGGHGAEVGQVLALQSRGDGAHGATSTQPASRPGAAPARRRRRVLDGRGVGHREDGGVAADGCGAAYR